MVLRFSAFVASVFLLASCGSSSVEVEKEEAFVIPDGEKLFIQSCSSCHGCDGTLGMSGALDLSKSTMTFNEMKFVIEKGKGAMPRFKEMLSKEGELDAVVEHVRTLKKD